MKERPEFTPEIITELEPHEVFVFGSNVFGKHVGGAALFAKEHFGAKEGKYEGLTGQCYALPTIGEDFCPLPLFGLVNSLFNFIKCAAEHEDHLFYLTPVGCGIAKIPIGKVRLALRLALKKYQMGNIPNPAPTNIVYPKLFVKDCLDCKYFSSFREIHNDPLELEEAGCCSVNGADDMYVVCEGSICELYENLD